MDPILTMKEVMTLEEVAEYLQVSQKSILRMAQSGKIPAAKVASQWRFMRSIVDDWLMAQMEIPSVRSGSPKRDIPRLPPLPDLMPPSMMNLDVVPDTKEKVLKQLIEPLRKARILRHTRRFLDSLLKRERLVSTAIGHGIAIPHPRRPLPGIFKDSRIALGICREGTDFEALDHQRTYIFFLLCAPMDDMQLRLLSRVIQFGRHMVAMEHLKKAATAEAVGNVLRASDDFPVEV